MSSKKQAETKDTEPVMQKGTNTLMVAVLATVLIAFPVGYVVGAQVSDDDTDETISMETDADSHSHSEDSHSHSETYEVGDAALIPSVELMVMEDEKSGWNVTLTTENFTFTPENVNGEHVDNEGHAHIWVDGEKLARIYSESYHIDDLGEGEHEISVTLNTNKHADYTVDGETIMDTVMVMHTHSDGDSHSHSN